MSFDAVVVALDDSKYEVAILQKGTILVTYTFCVASDGRKYYVADGAIVSTTSTSKCNVISANG